MIPTIFGQIAAANALSDVNAMGGEPEDSTEYRGFFRKRWIQRSWVRFLREVLTKYWRQAQSLQAVIPSRTTHRKYGLSVTGFVDPEKFWKNYGAQTGDRLDPDQAAWDRNRQYCDQHLCIGESKEAALRSMKTLNKYACDILRKYTIHACTDVTGFGLGGHGTEMADGSQEDTGH